MYSLLTVLSELLLTIRTQQILNQLVEGEGLAPLVGRDLLLQHLYLDSTEVAHQFFDSIFPEVNEAVAPVSFFH